MAFWDVMPCNVVDRYQHLGGTCCLHLRGRREFGTYLPKYMSSLSKTSQLSYSSLCENRNINVYPFMQNISISVTPRRHIGHPQSASIGPYSWPVLNSVPYNALI
jgi:hypothetical protein